MANLSLTELTKENREYRSVLLVEKVFQLNGKQNNFQTDGGIFHASGLIIGSEKITRISNAEDIAAKILGLKVKKNKTLMLLGKYVGKNTQQEVRVTQVLKSEEFGGQPAGGTRVNRGLVFESDLAERLDECSKARPCKGKYADATMQIIEMCSEKVGAPMTDFVHEGGANQSRPLQSSGQGIIIAPANHRDHAQRLTDITLIHGASKKSYLSLKFGSTLTLMNSGIANILTEREISNSKIQNSVGQAILKTFGLDETEFCSVFNNYNLGKVHQTGVKAKVNKSLLKNFLSTAIGSGYWMIHGHGGGSMSVWYMDPSKNGAMATINGDVIIDYGGRSGKGKRVDIRFSNSYFDFKVNIRNKQGGKYPSHIMCDYVSKSALGKKTLR